MMAYRIRKLYSICGNSGVGCFERDTVFFRSLDEINSPIKVVNILDHWAEKSVPKKVTRQFYTVFLSNNNCLQLPKDKYVAEWEYIE